MLNTKLLFFCCFLLSYSSFPQTGPGGVGSTGGDSNLIIWLKADDLDADGSFANNPVNGSAVSLWADHSGYGNNFTQNGTNRPNYNNGGAFNGVTFNVGPGTAKHMVSSLTGNYADASSFFAIRPVNLPNSSVLLDNSSVSLRVEQWRNTQRVGLTRYGVADYSSGLVSPFNTNAIISYHKTAAQNQLLLKVNTNWEQLNIGSAATGLPVDHIGRNSTFADRASGDIFEVIFYNQRLNDAQVIIVDNYLSAKFGSIPVLNDVYDEDEALNGNYDYDVAGIGRINATQLHTDAQGSGILRIRNPMDLDDNEFMIWGHNSTPLNTIIMTDLPAKMLSRLAHEWRVSEVSVAGMATDVGAVDMEFDLGSLNPINHTQLRLLVDTDNDGQFADETPIGGAIHLGNNRFRFIQQTALENNLRFTLGIGETSIITNRRITHRVSNN